jgi:hypothetical protein
MSKFDFLAALLDFGLTHVVEGILELLDVEDVAAVQLVSKLWYVLCSSRDHLERIVIRNTKEGNLRFEVALEIVH